MGARKFSTFDVRPVLARGEEPFPEIRARASRLTGGSGLIVIAPFLPAPLIEILRSEGFEVSVEHRSDGGWSVSLWRE